MDDTHLVGRLTVEAAVADLDTAMALRPRLEALCRDRLPAVLDRVCSALAPAGLDLRLGRVELDLGVLRPDRLDEDLPAALEAALAERLAHLVPAARRNAGEDARAFARPDARLRRFESYLLDGALPLLARARPFDPLARLTELAAEQPDALIAMLRRHANKPHVLERLVLQLGETGLEQLLALLAPADAAVIAGLLADVVALGRTDPPPAPPPDAERVFERVGEGELRRRVWITSLEFLLRDQGSQFNRRRFLRHLLEREARRAGIGYAAFLRLMAEAADRAARRSPLRSSLPRTLAELVEEFEDDRSRRADGRAGERNGGRDAAVAAPGAGDAAGADGERRLRRDRVGLFLAGGGPPGAGAALVEAAALDRGWLAGTLRSRAREAPGRAAALVRRLLDWLPPSDALALLAGGRDDGAAALDPADPALAAALADSSVSGAEEIGRRLDREDRLERWLSAAADADTATATAEDPAIPEDAPALFAGLTLARLSDLLLTGEAGDSLRRLSRAFRALGPGGDAALARRLMPWIARRDGPLAPLLAGHGGEARVAVLLRAAAGEERAASPAAFRPGRPLSAIARDLAALADAAEFPLPGGATACTDLGPLPNPPLPPASAQTKFALTRQADHRSAESGKKVGARGMHRVDSREILPRHPLTPTLSPVGRGDPALSNEMRAYRGPGGERGNPSPEPQHPDPQAVFAWLDGAGGPPGGDAELTRHFALLADRDDPALRAYLAANRMRPAARTRWAALLPQPALGRLVGLLVPAGAGALVDAVLLVGAAWRHTAPFGARRPDPRFLWSALLERIAEPRPVDLAGVLAGLIDSLAGEEERLRAKLSLRARHLAREGGHVAIGAALRRAGRPRGGARRSPPVPPSPSQAKPSPPPPPPPPPSGWRFEGWSGGEAAPLYVGNAGLVLFAPYLPMLFERLGLSPSAPEHPGVADLSRAAHLLQYLADGRLDAPEPELVLNKLLCGQPAAAPVERALAAAPADLELCDGLIRAVLDAWPPLRNSSPAALRETFLQREGRLDHAEGAWRLQVQRRTLDVLVDQLPWGFSVVYHRWMKEPIHVAW